MPAHDWPLYIQMQLVPHHRPDALESVPILQPDDDGGDSESEPEVSNATGDERRIDISGAGGESVSALPHESRSREVSTESRDREIEERESEESLVQDQPQCRICLDTGGDDMIAPCHCRGTQKYVHRSCLDHWRSTKEGFAFAHCTECRAVFLLRANVPPDRWWLRLKFQLLVVRDHTVIFIIVQLLIPGRSIESYQQICVGLHDFMEATCKHTYDHIQKLTGMSYGYDLLLVFIFNLPSATCLVVMMLAMLVYKFYGEELREMFEYEDHPYAFYGMSIIAVLLVGLLYGFFIAIICGQRIHERHYHVLAKQELTKEFIVEDREKSESVPELDSSHVMELRMLGLY